MALANELSGVKARSQPKILRGVSLRRSLLALLIGLALWASLWSGVAYASSPQEVVKTYLRAVFARDYRTAYQWISREDQKLKSRNVYVREKGAFSGAALEVTRTLASLIRFDDFNTVLEGDRATVTFTVTLPNANDPTIQNLVLEFDEERLAALPAAERQARVDRLREMARTDHLPVIVGDGQFELVREDESWRMFVNWAGAVMVRFEGVTKAGLPWEFAPVQPVVRANPGVTLQTFYRVKNVSDRQITGKARHVLDPPEETGHLEIVTCFCFIQQTLDPGEEQELPVSFRVNYEVPKSITKMRVRYEFYPIDQFPAGDRQ